MSAEREVTPPPHVLQLLDPDEELRHQPPAKDLVLVLTDRRLVVADDDRVTLDIPYPRLRRVQLDVEVDPSLLGGLVVRVGDRLIDGSVRSRLERLRNQLVSGAL